MQPSQEESAGENKKKNEEEREEREEQREQRSSERTPDQERDPDQEDQPPEGVVAFAPNLVWDRMYYFPYPADRKRLVEPMTTYVRNLVHLPLLLAAVDESTGQSIQQQYEVLAEILEVLYTLGEISLTDLAYVLHVITNIYDVAMVSGANQVTFPVAHMDLEHALKTVVRDLRPRTQG